ncbi:Glycylpeptide N-tetradecanoyltransferase, partial [Filobasidium floriforme]
EDIRSDEEDVDEEDDDDEEEGKVAAADAPAAGSSKSKKKKKNKKKSKSKAVDKLKGMINPGGNVPDELVDAVKREMQQNPATQSAQVDDEEIRRALKAMDLLKVLEGKEALGNKSNTKDIGEHKFWKTQPVPQTLSENLHRASRGTVPPASANQEPDGPIDSVKDVADVRKEPLPLPKGYEWCTPDITIDEECKEVQTLLSENYVEDDDASFRLHYSKEFLHWALAPPEYVADWHLGVRQTSNKKLVAFISGIPLSTRVRDHTIKTAEINFLVTHKKLRSKRLAPVLIKEVTRRVNLKGVWQAVYTAGVVLPTPIGVCRYYHRTLNPVKLVDIGFTPVRRGDTVSRMVRRFGLPASTSTPNFREMCKEDIPQVLDLMKRYMARFELEQKFDTEEEIEHWFISGRGTGEYVKGQGRKGQVAWAYVVEASDPETHRITDFMSFYSLPSLIMKHAKHKDLGTAYLFYYATDAALSSSSSQGGEEKAKERLSKRLNSLVNDCLIVAKDAGFDVFNALTMMDNNLFLNEQLFGPGDGYLVNYLYNWRSAPIDGAADGVDVLRTSNIGVVML